MASCIMFIQLYLWIYNWHPLVIAFNYFYVAIQYNPIEIGKPIYVASVDFDNSTIASMDKIYHSTKELFDWLNEIKRVTFGQTFEVVLREFTFQEVDDIHWEDDIWQFDWLECFNHKELETFKM